MMEANGMGKSKREPGNMFTYITCTTEMSLRPRVHANFETRKEKLQLKNITSLLSVPGSCNCEPMQAVTDTLLIRPEQLVLFCLVSHFSSAQYLPVINTNKYHLPI